MRAVKRELTAITSAQPVVASSSQSSGSRYARVSAERARVTRSLSGKWQREHGRAQPQERHGAETPSQKITSATRANTQHSASAM